MTVKAVLLDRDGVINPNVKDLVKPEMYSLLDGVGPAIKRLNDAGYLAIVITNQPIIAKGFCTFADMDRIHQKMRDLLSVYGARIDAIYLCPHHPEAGFAGEVKELKIDCNCRKPKSGLLEQAVSEHHIDKKNCWTIGDSKSDIMAGQKIGIQTIFLTAGGGSLAKAEQLYANVVADVTVANLPEAVDYILKH